MPGDNRRFTSQWDAVDPFDREYPHLWIKVEHLGRYLFAAAYLAEQKARCIVDIGSGAGYGTRELARIANAVFAIDADPEYIQQLSADADSSIKAFTLQLGVDPLVNALGERQVDGIVCFETLEHLTDPGGSLAEVYSHLAPGGHLILSVPNSVAERTDPAGLLSNQFHHRMFTISSITELILEAGFRVRHVLGQPLAAEINRNETRLIRRNQTRGRIGDEPEFHDPATIRRMALAIGYPEQRDVERSYSIIVVATRD